jgi:hypothetical protein
MTPLERAHNCIQRAANLDAAKAWAEQILIGADRAALQQLKELVQTGVSLESPLLRDFLAQGIVDLWKENTETRIRKDLVRKIIGLVQDEYLKIDKRLSSEAARKIAQKELAHAVDG